MCVCVYVCVCVCVCVCVRACLSVRARVRVHALRCSHARANAYTDTHTFANVYTTFASQLHPHPHSHNHPHPRRDAPVALACQLREGDIDSEFAKQTSHAPGVIRRDTSVLISCPQQHRQAHQIGCEVRTVMVCNACLKDSTQRRVEMLQLLIQVEEDVGVGVLLASPPARERCHTLGGVRVVHSHHVAPVPTARMPRVEPARHINLPVAKGGVRGHGTRKRGDAVHGVLEAGAFPVVGTLALRRQDPRTLEAKDEVSPLATGLLILVRVDLLVGRRV